MSMLASSDQHVRVAAPNFERSKMTMFHSHQDTIRDQIGGEAYRAYLITRNQSPIVKRLRVLARRVGSRVRAALGVIHKAIVTAKMRRIQRELMFHTKDITDFPQRPLILGDKWDS
jgi:hypothetical protein